MPGTLARLAVMERCEPVLLYIAEAARRVAPEQEPWASLRAHVASRRRVRTECLPHWSRFVLQTGYTPDGREQPSEWLTRDEDNPLEILRTLDRHLPKPCPTSRKSANSLLPRLKALKLANDLLNNT